MSIRQLIRERVRELSKFGTVGLAGVVINIGSFNLLRLGPFAPDATIAGADDRVVTAKVIATVISILFAWVAHRQWTFSGPRRHRPTRELVAFTAVNLVALGIEAAAVATSHHLLGFTSALADNAATLVGIGLGTVVRYLAYRKFVFQGVPSAPSRVAIAADPLATPANAETNAPD